MRVKLTVAYDGTDYCGWQVQPNGIAVQQKVNEAVSDLFGQPIEVIGASRTDAGVHALGNVCCFDVETRMPAEKISYALNVRLPKDIVVVDSCEEEEGFHPRFTPSRKTYEYLILNRRFPDPTRSRNTFFYHRKLDVDAMKQAASCLVGKHDFRSFASAHMQAKGSVRILYSCSVWKEDDLITIRVTGSGFLYNMVRIIAGTLIKAGEGAIRPEQMEGILRACDRKASGPTAPPQGLTLVEIEYE